MEDRLAAVMQDGRRPGWALVALVAIVLITAEWWALALWPASAEPEWLVRTRAACFGSAKGGLPDTSGWILLIGQPLGMLGMLFAVGGRSLRLDFAWLMEQPVRRAVTMMVTGAVVIVTAMLGVRIERAWDGGRNLYAVDTGALRRVRLGFPEISLVDQRGRAVSLAQLGHGPAIVTFSFGHCATVCPVIVNDLRAARARSGRSDLPIVVLTLDPWRDTPDRLSTLATSWHLGIDDRVLSGEVPAVNAALDSLGISRRRNERTGDVDHAATVLLVGRDGRIQWRGDGGIAGVEEMLERM